MNAPGEARRVPTVADRNMPTLEEALLDVFEMRVLLQQFCDLVAYNPPESHGSLARAHHIIVRDWLVNRGTSRVFMGAAAAFVKSLEHAERETEPG